MVNWSHFYTPPIGNIVTSARNNKHYVALEIAKELGKDAIPAICYHRNCRSTYILRSKYLQDLEPLNKEHDQENVTLFSYCGSQKLA